MTSAAKPRLKAIFNFGLKVPDARSEKEFFDAFNPDRAFVVDRRNSPAGAKKVPAVEFGDVKFFMFEGLSYDSDTPEPHPGGIGHVSFMVDDLDALMVQLEGEGVMPLRGPYVSDIGDLGRRKIVFYRSPNGTIIEPQQLLD